MSILSCPSFCQLYVHEGASTPEGTSYEAVGMTETWIPGMGRSRHVKMKVPGCVPAVPFRWPLLASAPIASACPDPICLPRWGIPCGGLCFFCCFNSKIFLFFFFNEVFFFSQSTNQLSLYGELKPHCIRQAVTWFVTIFPIPSLQSCTVANCWLLKMFLTYMWFFFFLISVSLKGLNGSLKEPVYVFASFWG